MSATSVETSASTAPAATPLSDEQILGIEPESGEAQVAFGGDGSGSTEVANGPVVDQSKCVDSERTRTDENRAGARNEIATSEMPEWLVKVSEGLPEAPGDDARARLAEMWQRSAELDAFDAAYFGEDPSARQAFVARLHAENPGALRAMYESAAEVLAGGAGTNAADRAGTSRGDGSGRREGLAASGTNSEFNPAQYAVFESATNDAVMAELNREIGRLMTRALPEGVADGARRRMSEDTLAEVHEILRGDRQLGAQVSEAIRGGNFSTAARDHVARLIAARARGVLPAAAKRVIGEWTSSVLATHRESAARQAASQKRVDIVGGAVPQGTARKGPREIDYRNTSDEEILSW